MPFAGVVSGHYQCPASAHLGELVQGTGVKRSDWPERPNFKAISTITQNWVSWNLPSFLWTRIPFKKNTHQNNAPRPAPVRVDSSYCAGSFFCPTHGPARHPEPSAVAAPFPNLGGLVVVQYAVEPKSVLWERTFGDEGVGR